MHGTCRLESVTTTCAQHVCALIDGIGGSVQTATTAIAVWASGLRGCHPEGWMRRDTLLGPVGSHRRSVVGNATALLAAYLALLVLIYGLGLDTLGESLHKHWQYLDLRELKQRPLTSLLYQHSQPPLLNAVVAALSQLPWQLNDAFVQLNCALVSVSCVLLFHVMRHLRVATATAGAAATAYLLAPATLLNAAYPFYPTMTAFLYVTLVYSFVLGERHIRIGHPLVVASLLSLSLLRTSFTLVHMVLMYGAFAYMYRDRIRRAALVGGVALMLLGATVVPVKNLAIYGFFGSSSWSALNLASATQVNLGLAPFAPPDQVVERFPEMARCKFHAAVDRDLRKADGYPNYNSCVTLEFSRFYRSRFLAAVSAPRYARNVVRHLRAYLAPPDKYLFLENRGALNAYADAFNAVWLTRTFAFANPALGAEGMETRVLAVLLICGFGLLFLKRWRRLDVLTVASGLLLAHLATHVLTDGVEGQRFVFDVEFVFYVWLAVAVTYGRALWARLTARSPDARYRGSADQSRSGGPVG